MSLYSILSLCSHLYTCSSQEVCPVTIATKGTTMVCIWTAPTCPVAKAPIHRSTSQETVTVAAGNPSPVVHTPTLPRVARTVATGRAMELLITQRKAERRYSINNMVQWCKLVRGRRSSSSSSMWPIPSSRWRATARMKPHPYQWVIVIIIIYYYKEGVKIVSFLTGSVLCGEYIHVCRPIAPFISPRLLSSFCWLYSMLFQHSHSWWHDTVHLLKIRHENNIAWASLNF